MPNRKQFATLDAETDPFKIGRFPRPFIWGFYDGERYEEFTDTDKLVKFLAFQELVVFAHNGGKFDYHFMLDYLHPYDEVMVIAGRLAKFNIGLCEFRDSMNILPVPLAAYEKESFDYSLMEPGERDKPENKKKISDYLYSDCVNLYNMIDKFESEYGRNLTQASAAMKEWTRISGRKPPQSSKEYYYQFAPFYYGGRVQCFEQGKINGPFQSADINSAYPYAMLHRHPISLEYVYENGEPDTDEIGPLFFIVECVARGCFPFRTDDGLYFPADDKRRIYYITGWELQVARDTGTIEGELIIGYYQHYEMIDFSDYINCFYARRQLAKETDDKAGDLFAKLLMNSLYGKFASNPEKYGKFQLHEHEDMPVLQANMNGNDPEQFHFGGFLGPWILAQRGLADEEQRFYNIATAASITGFVRAYLWRNICRCDDVLYCDTDSIAAVSVDSLDFGTQLGQWGIEGEYSHGYIAGKKMYAFKERDGDDWKMASKGVRLSPVEMQQVAEGGEIVYNPIAPTYSIHHEPRFTSRRIVATAKDASKPEG